MSDPAATREWTESRSGQAGPERDAAPAAAEAALDLDAARLLAARAVAPDGRAAPWDGRGAPATPRPVPAPTWATSVLTPQRVLGLQRVAGNDAVLQLLRTDERQRGGPRGGQVDAAEAIVAPEEASEPRAGATEAVTEADVGPTAGGEPRGGGGQTAGPAEVAAEAGDMADTAAVSRADVAVVDAAERATDRAPVPEAPSGPSVAEAGGPAAPVAPRQAARARGRTPPPAAEVEPEAEPAGGQGIGVGGLPGGAAAATLTPPSLPSTPSLADPNAALIGEAVTEAGSSGIAALAAATADGLALIEAAVARSAGEIDTLAAGERRRVGGAFVGARRRVQRAVATAAEEIQAAGDAGQEQLDAGLSQQQQAAADATTDAEDRVRTAGRRRGREAIDTANEAGRNARTRLEDMADRARNMGNNRAARARGATPQSTRAQREAARRIAGDTAREIIRSVADTVHELRGVGPEVCMEFVRQADDIAGRLGAQMGPVQEQLTAVHDQAGEVVCQGVDSGLNSVDQLGQVLTASLASLEADVQRAIRSQARAGRRGLVEAGAAASTSVRVQYEAAAQAGADLVATIIQSSGNRRIRRAAAQRMAGQLRGHVAGGFATTERQARAGMAEVVSSFAIAAESAREEISRAAEQGAAAAASTAGQGEDQIGQAQEQLITQLLDMVNEAVASGDAVVSGGQRALDSAVNQVDERFVNAISELRANLAERVSEQAVRAREPLGSLPGRLDEGMTRAENRATSGWFMRQLYDIGESINWGFVAGLIVGLLVTILVILLIGTGIGALILAGALAGALGVAASTLTEDAIAGRPTDWGRLGRDMLIGAALGALGGAIGGGVSGALGSAVTRGAISVATEVAVNRVTSVTVGVVTGVVQNAINGDPWDKGLLLNVAVGVATTYGPGARAMEGLTNRARAMSIDRGTALNVTAAERTAAAARAEARSSRAAPAPEAPAPPAPSPDAAAAAEAVTSGAGAAPEGVGGPTAPAEAPAPEVPAAAGPTVEAAPPPPTAPEAGPAPAASAEGGGAPAPAAPAEAGVAPAAPAEGGVAPAPEAGPAPAEAPGAPEPAVRREGAAPAPEVGAAPEAAPPEAAPRPEVGAAPEAAPPEAAPAPEAGAAPAETRAEPGAAPETAPPEAGATTEGGTPAEPAPAPEGATPEGGPAPESRTGPEPGVPENVPETIGEAPRARPEEPSAHAAEATREPPGHAAEATAEPPASGREVVTPEEAAGRTRPSDVSGPLSPDVIEGVFGMPVENQQRFQAICDREGVVVEVRPTNPEAPRLLREGAAPKPSEIHAKSINELDTYIGARGQDVGTVGFFEPEMPRRPAHMSEAEWQRILPDVDARFVERYNEWQAYGERMAELGLPPGEHPGGPRIEVDENGVVQQVSGPPAEEVRQPFTGDHDVFDLRYADGSPVPDDVYNRIINEMRAAGMGVQHGAHMRWVPATPADWNIYNSIVGRHMAGGEPLIRFAPGETPRTTFAGRPKAVRWRPRRAQRRSPRVVPRSRQPSAPRASFQPRPGSHPPLPRARRPRSRQTSGPPSRPVPLPRRPARQPADRTSRRPSTVSAARGGATGGPSCGSSATRQSGAWR
ncbi:MAG: hypothetical protein H6Q36_1346 [Chloroflexi bacterium]|nr:hypothetical protein [Chloroflexota bacterium]